MMTVLKLNIAEEDVPGRGESADFDISILFHLAVWWLPYPGLTFQSWIVIIPHSRLHRRTPVAWLSTVPYFLRCKLGTIELEGCFPLSIHSSPTLSTQVSRKIISTWEEMAVVLGRARGAHGITHKLRWYFKNSPFSVIHLPKWKRRSDKNGVYCPYTHT